MLYGEFYENFQSRCIEELIWLKVAGYKIINYLF